MRDFGPTPRGCMALPAVAGSTSMADVDHADGEIGRREHENCTEEDRAMGPQERAPNEQFPDQKPRKRRHLGRLSWRQERALNELLARGLSSIRWAAQEVDVPYSTMRRWLEADHP